MNNLYIQVNRGMFLMFCCLISMLNPVNSQNPPVSSPLGGSHSVYDSIAGLFENTKASYDFPPVWEEPVITGNVHGIIVMLEANTRVNDTLLNPGDYIGGFYTDDFGELRCGGAYFLIEGENIIFSLFADDPDTPEKDGFGYAETIHFKLFSWTTLKEYDVDVIEFNTSGLYTSTNKWYPLGISQIVDLQALVDMDFYIKANSNPLCINSKLKLSAEEFIGSSGPYTFEWTSDPPGFYSTSQEPDTITSDTTTTYFLTVEDGLLASENQLTVIVNDSVQASAGPDGSVCGNESFSLNGTASNYENIMWVSSGDGFFDDPVSLSTFYTLGNQDIQNGNSIITLIAHPLNPCKTNATDTLLLQVLPLPIVYAGEDMSACGNDVVFLDANAQYYNTIEWTTSGDGEFSNPNDTVTQYAPGPGDINNSEVTLMVCADATTPCVSSACDDIVISYLAGPSCITSTNITQCENIPMLLWGLADNNDGILWTTQGDGHFVDSTVINTQYIAGPVDRENGGTTVTLNALPIAPCATPATKDVNVILKPLPEVDAGEDVIVTDYENIFLTATVSNSFDILWETNGDGEFTSPGEITTQYIPGENEIISGSTIITASVNSIYPCSGVVTDQINLYYTETIYVNAGDDVVICNGDEVFLEGIANNYQSVEWSGTGDGIFQNTNELSTIYTPGSNDIINGQVTLTLTAEPIPPETDPVSDQLVVTIVEEASVDAGDDQSICETENVQLNASASNYHIIQWTTNGDGLFSNLNILNPVYSPGYGDKQNGGVELAVYASSMQPCTFTDNDAVSISITKNPNAYAGPDAVICETSVLSLSGQAQNSQQVLWETNGDGYFVNPQNLQTNYHPGQQDIQNGSAELTLNAQPQAPCLVSGSDALLLGIQKLPLASAGPDHSICETENVTLNGNASNYSSVTWTTSGDGDFSNPNNLTTNYILGNQDKINGTVSLTLIAGPLSPCMVADEDIANVSITRMPFANAGNNTTICEDGQVILDGGAQNFSSILWSTLAGDGTFNNNSILDPSYTPGPIDISSGSVTLCLTATSTGNCPPASDCIIVNITSFPEAFAGEDDIATYGQAYLIEGATAQNAQSILWSTPNGTGVYSNTSIINPTYTPSDGDLNVGIITLTLSVQPIGPCLTGATDSFELTVTSDCIDPVAFAGGDATICETGTFEITGSSAENFSSIEWASNGDGSFNDPSDLHPVYTPGANDLSNGFVNVCLTAFAFEICEDANDCMTLTFQELPTVNAGENQTVCEGGTVPVTATGTHYDVITWWTGGDGDFDNAGESSTTYTPGQDDINNGSVTLCATATGIAGCEEITDCIIIEFQQPPIANAGDDQTLCSGSVAHLSGQAENHGSALWETSGDGVFDNPNNINAQYTHGAQDIANGTVEICLWVSGLYGCEDGSDCMVLNIIEPPIAFAGDDETICEGDMVVLNGFAENYQSVSWSTTGGDGSFTDNNSLYTEYTPGPEDINNGSVSLCLTSTGLANCEDVEDCTDITINKQPMVDAGTDQIACLGSNASFIGSAENYADVFWQTSGDGTFTNPIGLSTDYIPGTQDIATGIVDICLNATGLAGCDGQSNCISLTIEQPPIVTAGDDATICESGVFQINAVADHYSSILWQSSGDGGFDNPSILSPVYSPGPNDLVAGQAELCVTALPLQICGEGSDCVIVHFQKNPVVDAGSDAIIQMNESYTATGASVQNYDALLWTTSGTGTFDDASLLNSVYTSSYADYLAGSVVLGLSASAIDPCTFYVEDQLTLNFAISCTPEADAGLDEAVCENQVIQLNGTAQNFGSIEWATSGDGSFDDPNAENPEYSPGENDIESGIVELCLTAFAADTCQDVTDCMNLTVIKTPFAFAGTGRTVPTGTAIEMSDAYAENYNLIQWATLNGTGNFSNESIINPIYGPGPSDWSQGYVLLQMAASSINPCEISSEDIVEITFVTDCQDAVINTPGELNICETSAFVQIDATADFFTTLSWTTSGDGSFNHPNIANPAYHCGANDVVAGQVKLYLTAEAYNECNSASDSVILFIHSAPIVNAGNNATICGTEEYEIFGSADNYQSFTWSTNGDGIFNNDNSLTPTYIPGDNDLISESVNICLNVEGYGSCPNESDCLTLTIQNAPLAFAGQDSVINAGEDYFIADAVANHHETILWETSGTGTFNDNSIQNPVYTASELDQSSNSVTLTIITNPVGPCSSSDTDDMILGFNHTCQDAIVNAGQDITVCENESVNLTANAENYSSIIWETNGDGSFDNPEILNAVYTPGADDKQTGQVELCLTAFANGQCEDASDCITINIEAAPSAFAGDDFEVCENDTIQLSGLIENSNDFEWTSTGDGSFSDAAALVTSYLPGTNDISNGTVELCLNAFALSQCSTHTDCIIITLEPAPTAFAGEDHTICAPSSFFVLCGQASFSDITLWSTSGDGYFDDPQILGPAYYPGTDDLSNGFVSICLEAGSSSACDPVQDSVTITFLEGASANVGNDIDVCSSVSYVLLNGTVSNNTGFYWTTSGSGSFVPHTGLTPKYFPSYYDKMVGQIDIILTAQHAECGDVKDTLTLTFHPAPTADAGENATICANETYTLLAASVSDEESVLWNTDGDGYFDDPESIITTYNPGTLDIQSGFVGLCLTAFGYEACGDATDCLTLTLNPSAIVDAGDDQSICETGDAQLSAIADNYDEILWATSGDGTFNDPSILNPVYYPGGQDIQNLIVNLSVEATSSSNCGNASDNLTINIILVPNVQAGDDATICESQTLQLNGNANNNTSIEWSTLGDGSFSDGFILDPVYVPGIDDVLNGQVDLCLTAFGNSTCGDVSDCLTLTIQQAPVANAGGNATICHTSAFYTTNGSASFHSGTEWNTNGDGYFDDVAALVTNYYPGALDISAGNVLLCLTANGLSGCGPVEDCMALSFQVSPTVDAGIDISICEDETPILSGSAEDYSSVIWTTNGDGTFANPDKLGTLYTPGEDDIAAGNATLCLEVIGIGGCANQQDCLDLSIFKLPEALAGEDQSICAGQASEVSGEAQNFQSVEWVSTGDGIFTDPFALNTIYTPGTEDLTAGFVDVCLTAVSPVNCDDATDCFTLVILSLPTVIAGNDIETCENSTIQLDGQSTNYSSLNWTTNGTGGFSNTHLLDPIYYPSDDDKQNGTVELCLKANGLNGCEDTTDCLTVTIYPLPEAVAGPNITICESGSLSLTGQAINANGILWETSGDGYFDDYSSLETTYYPGMLDHLNKTAQICLTAYGMGSCPDDTDCLELTLQPGAMVFAGDDFNSCEVGTITLNGWADNYSSVLWGTNGDGTFTDPSALNTSYFPGFGDLFNGYVEFCLTATGLNGCGDVEDCATVTLILSPIAYAGENATIEQGDIYLTDEAFAENYSNVIWGTSGTGAFENENELLTTYFPSELDLSSGLVYLELTAQPIEPCTIIATHSLALTLQVDSCLNAIALAGGDDTVCNGQNYTVSGTAYNYVSTVWNTSGDGSFNDPSSLETIYTPGQGDYLNGSVEICLTAFAEDECSDGTDCFTLYFQEPPIVFAGTDNTIPKYEVYYIGDAYTENYNYVQWVTTNGTGTFMNETDINAIYQPGPLDWMQGFVELQLNISPIQPCEVFVDDKLIINFIDICENALADAGEDIEVCLNNNSVQMEATANYFSSLSWSTGGDGSFNYPNTLNPVYTFGDNDKLNGQVTLTLDAGAFGDCSPASDEVLVTIHDAPTVDVGDGFSVCGPDGFAISGTAENYSGFIWATSGDGEFIDENTLNPTYIPGSADLTNGGVNICLEVSGHGICQTASGCMFIGITPLPIAFAGVDDTICETGSYQLSATAENYSNISWGTNGDGNFDDPSSLTAIYAPGETDIQNGLVELCLQVVGPNDCGNTSDCMILSFQSPPEAYAGIDATIFAQDSYTLVGATADHYSEVLWETSGNGIFLQPTDINPTYVSTMEDYLASPVTLKIIANAIDPCTVAVQDEMVLTIQYPCDDAVADAGEDFTSCLQEEAILNGVAENYDGLLWETNGDGSFTEPNSLVSGYLPGVDDIAAGSVVVCLTAFAEATCLDSTDCVEISFVHAPTIHAGDDLTICETDGTVPLSAIAENYSDVMWFSSGNGFFQDATSLETNYNLGMDDILSGTVTLTITANSALCPYASSSIVVSIIPSVALYAGENSSICDYETFTASDAFVNNAGSTLWTTSGDGYFADSSSVVTEYFPGQNDIDTGEAELCLFAEAFEPCADASQCIILTLQPSAFVYAGDDDTVCETETVLLNATATDYVQVLWSSSGDGTFLIPDKLSTVYTPGEQDIATGLVTLTIDATSSTGCNDAVDEIIISIDKAPVAFAGGGFTVCFPGEILLNGTAENYSTVLWGSNGDGSFTDSTSLDTEYLPGVDDIAAGFAEVCLTAYSDGVCPDSVDCITITFNNSPVVSAGGDLTICETDGIVPLSANAENYSDVMWISSGNGFFQDATSLETDYILGTEDIYNGEVTLTITANSALCPSASDSIVVSISPSVIMYAGENSSICDFETFTTSDAFVDNAKSILWTTSGDGYFADPYSVVTEYFPGQNDIDTGEAELCLFADAFEPCADASQCITLTIRPSVTVDAGEDVTVCETETVPLDAIAPYYDQVLWNTFGDGVFNDTTILNPVYTPGEQDIFTGTVTLTVDVAYSAGCNNAFDEIIISIDKAPIAFAGEGFTVCSGEVFLSGTAENYSTVLWVSNGDGSFTNPTSTDTEYLPGVDDIAAGFAEVCFTAYSYGVCVNSVDCITITFNNSPVVSAGGDLTICETDGIVPLSANAENYSDVMWVSSGNGTFQDATSLVTNYIPHLDDIFNGTVTLTITANSALCPSASDSIVVSISPSIIFYAGEDVSICDSETFTTSDAFVNNAESTLWTTSGDGYFADASSVVTEYFPGNIDKIMGETELCLFANAYGPCGDVSQCIVLSILPSASVYAGIDETICYTGTLLINAIATNYSNVFWTTSGDGEFLIPDKLGTVYTPGEGDIAAGFAFLRIEAFSSGNCEPALDSLLLTIYNLPVIVVDVTDVEVLLDGQAEFIIEATDVETYEWYGPGGFIPDNDLPVLTIENAGYEDEGEYYCVVANSCGSEISSTVTLLVYEEQIVSFAEGWGGLSSWIVPFDTAVENIFEDVENQLLTLENFTGVYSPPYNVNTLINWNTQDGYKSMFSDQVDIRFKGVANTDRTVELNTGWNYLPVVVGCPVNVEELFGNISEVEIIKEIAGSGIYWATYGINTIGELMPGNAYHIRVNNPVSVVFGDCDVMFKSTNASAHRPENLTKWNDLTYTPSTHIIAIDDKILDQFMPGDVIGAFTQQGICAGMMEIMIQKNCLTLFGDDQFTSVIDGFVENSLIKFKVYRPATGEEFELDVSFDRSLPNADGVFVTNGVSRIIDTEMSTTAIVGTNFGEINIFPNPTKGSVNISGVKNNSTIEIYTSGGQVLETITCNNNPGTVEILSIDLSTYPGGIIYFRVTSLEKVEVHKVILR